ncbi:hypothetical protein KO500_04830 [Cellulophaga baltica]|uniref:hypothetical protein n=1 Tax=Cellulophaga TaxID=104264 RepID=UPI001C06D10F|nr:MULTISPECIES: hypothetical protein [Cellulophaga]MBU2995743.1 hypothetical protein [Cellulophaga baltica]MDO6767137.1 hypothetical protein [Cellulophaga sp. 1_MG-2023]
MKNFYKNTLQALFLVLWLFAITGPTISAYLDKDSKVVVTNLSEEEHQEHEHNKKEKDLEKIFTDYLFLATDVTALNISIPSNYYFGGISSHTQDIQVPPPKEII